MVRGAPVLVLLSGGVGSSTLCLSLRDRGREVVPHFVVFGQRAAESEWAAARAVAQRLGLDAPGVSDLSDLGKSLDLSLLQGGMLGGDSGLDERFRESFLPHRHLLLATCGAMHAASRGIGAIALGFVGGTKTSGGTKAPSPDTTPLYLRRLQRLLRASAEVRVLAPFAHRSKSRVVRFGAERGFDYGLTYSCQRQSGIHCGQCPGCVQRERSLSGAPSATPTSYARPVVWVS
jgi:7-cyano-7-deazaguanine synthase